MTPSRNFDSGIEIANSNSSSSSNMSDHASVAANIAVKAAQVATAANDAQSNAAECAAKEVRIQLAEKAVQASKAVQAVLEGKRALLEKIEKELNAADDLLGKLRSSLYNSEKTAEKTECAAKKAEEDLARLSEIVQLLGGNVADVNALNEQAQNDYSDKLQMLMAATDRSKRIQKDIICARDEYQQVKEAAYQAACAAVQAKQKAARTVAFDSGAIPTAQLRRRRRRQQHPFWSETIFF
ncbi:PREDICTED: uncharacterized protein LOC108618009 [Drosophila arizonae]|uniref:Uncharacterized protein LOC108618009 n=1 Tax=Drosophila arizonae TaxID=7263 RepID=A0ABM1PQB7_DROAR|nr:PREDICTED: uncharacterized protein LOC108618009 [Drosophila arizonae]